MVKRIFKKIRSLLVLPFLCFFLLLSMISFFVLVILWNISEGKEEVE